MLDIFRKPAPAPIAKAEPRPLRFSTELLAWNQEAQPRIGRSRVQQWLRINRHGTMLRLVQPLSGYDLSFTERRPITNLKPVDRYFLCPNADADRLALRIQTDAGDREIDDKIIERAVAGAGELFECRNYTIAGDQLTEIDADHRGEFDSFGLLTLAAAKRCAQLWEQHDEKTAMLYLERATAALAEQLLQRYRAGDLELLDPELAAQRRREQVVADALVADGLAPLPDPDQA